jgi:hypothetical protein
MQTEDGVAEAKADEKKAKEDAEKAANARNLLAKATLDIEDEIDAVRRAKERRGFFARNLSNIHRAGSIAVLRSRIEPFKLILDKRIVILPPTDEEEALYYSICKSSLCLALEELDHRDIDSAGAYFHLAERLYLALSIHRIGMIEKGTASDEVMRPNGPEEAKSPNETNTPGSLAKEVAKELKSTGKKELTGSQVLILNQS